jgi:glycosyltransferase involved in cell wall biosynthesis
MTSSRIPGHCAHVCAGNAGGRPFGGSYTPHRDVRQLSTAAAGPPLVLIPVPRVADPRDGDAPHLDYLEVAAAIAGRISAPAHAAGLARLERRVGGWRQAVRARRSDARAFLSFSEKNGMALAALERRRPQVVIAHNLTTPRRRALQRATRWLRRVDRVIVLCRSQANYLRDEAGLSDECVRFVYDKVDHRFYAPRGAPEEGYVLAVGETRRDYPTLLEAVRALRVPMVLVASSPWTGDGAGPRIDPPPNVSLRRGLSFPELRDLYDRASVVVVPLHGGLDFAAGVNGVLEAMAMRKPVVVTGTPGITDYVRDGQDARVVPAGDREAMRVAIHELLTDRDQAERLAANARAVVDAGRNLDGFVDAVRGVLAEVTELG